MQLTISRSRLFTLVAGMVLAPAGIAHAGTLTFSDQFDYKTTNFNETLTIGKFDTSLGTLKSIQFDFNGNIAGDVRFESMDAADSTVTASLSSLLKLIAPDSTVLAEVNPFAEVSAQLTAFDGNIDFGGTSGRSFTRANGNGVSGTTSQSIRIDAPSETDLALFTANGGGTIDFSVAATGKSTTSGPGNVMTWVNTLASAGITVSYNYEETESKKIPEPTGAIGIAVVGGLALLRKRKKQDATELEENPSYSPLG